MATITLDDARLTDEDRQEAAEASRRLARGESLEALTPSLAQLLSAILRRIGDGETLHKKTKVSTTEAAEYLNVSRPYLYRLLSEGKLAYHTVGTHKRLYLKDVRAYKEHQDAVSYEAMRELQEQAQELNMGYKASNEAVDIDSLSLADALEAILGPQQTDHVGTSRWSDVEAPCDAD